MGKTVSQLFGFSPEETQAYLNTITGEAYLGGKGGDIAGVAANLITIRIVTGKQSYPSKPPLLTCKA